MPRKSKKKVENIDSEGFLYCSKRKCPKTSCLRHNANTPWGVPFYRTDDIKPDENWNCDYYTEERN